MDSNWFDVDHWFSKRFRRRRLDYNVLRNPNTLVYCILTSCLLSILFIVVALFSGSYCDMSIHTGVGIPFKDIHISFSLYDVRSTSRTLATRGHPMFDTDASRQVTQLILKTANGMSLDAFTSWACSFDSFSVHYFGLGCNEASLITFSSTVLIVMFCISLIITIIGTGSLVYFWFFLRAKQASRIRVSIVLSFAPVFTVLGLLQYLWVSQFGSMAGTYAHPMVTYATVSLSVGIGMIPAIISAIWQSCLPIIVVFVLPRDPYDDYEFNEGIMPVAAPGEGYFKMIAYGQHKAALRWDQLVLQSFAAGFWVALYGHACTVFAGYFYNSVQVYSAGLCKLAYGFLFPGAFVAVIYTGTELFTGNTVTMFMLLFNDGKKAIKPLVRIWTVSLFGNLTGAVFGAFLISWASGIFTEGTQHRDFLFSMAHQKVIHGFGENIILGIGCNAMVCLSTWCVVVTDDGAGKILAIFYSVGVFAMGGYEHIVANFYTLTAAHMLGYKATSFGEAVWRNWIPVLIGNLLAGTVFTGMLWWYALHPQYSDLAPFSNEELVTELERRVGSSADVKQEPGLRWSRSKSVAIGTKSFFNAPHLSPAGVSSVPPTDYSGYVTSQRQEPRQNINARVGVQEDASDPFSKSQAGATKG